VKRFDCGLIDKELCVARDPEHHYLIKFTLKNGEWVIGNKRNVIRARGDSRIRVEMTMGYYEEPVELRMRLKESDLDAIMNEVYRG